MITNPLTSNLLQSIYSITPPPSVHSLIYHFASRQASKRLNNKTSHKNVIFFFILRKLLVDCSYTYVLAHSTFFHFLFVLVFLEKSKPLNPTGRKQWRMVASEVKNWQIWQTWERTQRNEEKVGTTPSRPRRDRNRRHHEALLEVSFNESENIFVFTWELGIGNCRRSFSRLIVVKYAKMFRTVASHEVSYHVVYFMFSLPPTLILEVNEPLKIWFMEILCQVLISQKTGLGAAEPTKEGSTRGRGLEGCYRDYSWKL